MADTVPSFARVEISLGSKQDIIIAATQLRLLAADLDVISGEAHHTDENAVVLAHHRIKQTSQKLRGGGK